MKRLVLRPLMGGELAVWQRPAGNAAEYIVSCDPSLGRQWSEGADSSSVGVFRRWPGHFLEQCAEWNARWPIARVGEVVACLARAYGISYLDPETGNERNCATVNIERNIMDSAKFAMVENQRFSEEFFFVPREHRNVKPGEPKVYFTSKDHKNEHYLINTVEEYLDRKALMLRSKVTINELRTLEKDMSGSVRTGGKDRSVMVIMACVADQELAGVVAEREDKVEQEPECPVGVDRELWAKAHKKKTRGVTNVWSPDPSSVVSG